MKVIRTIPTSRRINTRVVITVPWWVLLFAESNALWRLVQLLHAYLQ